MLQEWRLSQQFCWSANSSLEAKIFYSVGWALRMAEMPPPYQQPELEGRTTWISIRTIWHSLYSDRDFLLLLSWNSQENNIQQFFLIKERCLQVSQNNFRLINLVVIFCSVCLLTFDLWKFNFNRHNFKPKYHLFQRMNGGSRRRNVVHVITFIPHRNIASHLRFAYRYKPRGITPTHLIQRLLKEALILLASREPTIDHQFCRCESSWSRPMDCDMIPHWYKCGLDGPLFQIFKSNGHRMKCI